MKIRIIILLIATIISSMLITNCEQKTEKDTKMPKDKKESVRKNKKVTGIGGIFFKCEDPKKMREW